MKMKLKNLLTIALATLLFACTNTTPNKVTISGVITNPKGDTIEIRMIDTTYIATLNENARFDITFSLDSATYLSFFHGDEITSMYLNGGEKVSLTIDTEQFDETIQYKGSDESNFLAWKYLYIEGEKDSQNVNAINNSTLVIQFGVTDNYKSVEDLSNYLDSLYQNIFDKLDNFKNSNFFDSEYKKCQASKETLLEKHKRVMKIPKAGELALDFAYPDSLGNVISLSDFLGKLVYVDIWATWCGPCVYQIPFLAQLEKDYHNKDVVFLSVSIDVENKKNTWTNMIKEKNMKGVQLISTDGWESQICKDYVINGIPRFMLFDTKGNVITTKAPRPNSDEIRGLLNANL